MNREKVDGLVIDLRNNGGGSLEEVRLMTGFFTGRGPVVQIKVAKCLREVVAQRVEAGGWPREFSTPRSKCICCRPL